MLTTRAKLQSKFKISIWREILKFQICGNINENIDKMLMLMDTNENKKKKKKSKKILR